MATVLSSGQSAVSDPFNPQPSLSLLYKLYRAEDEGDRALTPEEQAEWAVHLECFEEAERNRDRIGLVELAEVMEQGVPDVEMLIPDLLVAGTHHHVYGRKETSKTWILLHAAVELIKTDKTVLWVDEEMGRGLMAGRLKTLGTTPDEVRAHFKYLEFPRLDRTSNSRALWEALLRAEEPALVVFDAQTELLALADLGENSGTDLEKWAQAYLTPARKIGATTVMIDHTGHGPQDRARGTGHKGASAKVELLVDRVEDFDRNTLGRMTISVNKNTASAPIPKKQTFKIGGDGDGGFVFEPVDGAADPKAAARAERRMKIEGKIIDVLDEHEELSQGQLADLTGGNKQDVIEVAKGMAHSEDSAVQMKPKGRSMVYSIRISDD